MSHIQFLTSGEFGAAVARIAAREGDRIDALPLDDAGLHKRLATPADFVAVALWRPHQPVMAALNRLCRRLRVPWSVAELHGTRLSVGPLVMPGGRGCHECYLKRWGTHHPAPGRETVLQHFYNRNPDAGPSGYSPPAAVFAAAALRGDADAAADGRIEASGRLRVVDVLNVSVLESRVLPVHGCPACFPQPQGQPTGARFTRHLVPALKEVLP